MIDAERQVLHSAARVVGAPVVRTHCPTHCPTDHRRGVRCWHDAVTELKEAQVQYAIWLEVLPTSLQDSELAVALPGICNVEFAGPQAIDPPRRFGKD